MPLCWPDDWQPAAWWGSWQHSWQPPDCSPRVYRSRIRWLSSGPIRGSIFTTASTTSSRQFPNTTGSSCGAPLDGLRNAEAKVIWSKHASGPMSHHIWALELHRIDGKWYIHFAAGWAEAIWDIRMYVLENTSEPFCWNGARSLGQASQRLG
jgi:hypothetical protein